MEKKSPAPRNRTIILSNEDEIKYKKKLLTIRNEAEIAAIINRTIHGDSLKVLPLLPSECVDLIFTDPPYNLSKKFNKSTFSARSDEAYRIYLESWVPQLQRILKPTGTLYICGDWRCSNVIKEVGQKYFQVKNRITWEREKGRGSKTNFKSTSEDIWFFTKSSSYTFNLNDVKIVKKVIAPYKDKEGKPKDWVKTKEGNFRLTHPSNIWTDLTVPFWSMPENTDHPTQKPEKLIARAILASSNENDVIFDPFLGSGTTSVVAKKLNRQFFGIELDQYYSCIIEKRLNMANKNIQIQGIDNGKFYERNNPIKKTKNK